MAPVADHQRIGQPPTFIELDVDGVIAVDLPLQIRTALARLIRTQRHRVSEALKYGVTVIWQGLFKQGHIEARQIISQPHQ